MCPGNLDEAAALPGQSNDVPRRSRLGKGGDFGFGVEIARSPWRLMELRLRKSIEDCKERE